MLYRGMMSSLKYHHCVVKCMSLYKYFCSVVFRTHIGCFFFNSNQFIWLEIFSDRFKSPFL